MTLYFVQAVVYYCKHYICCNKKKTGSGSGVGVIWVGQRHARDPETTKSVHDRLAVELRELPLTRACSTSSPALTICQLVSAVGHKILLFLLIGLVIASRRIKPKIVSRSCIGASRR